MNLDPRRRRILAVLAALALPPAAAAEEGDAGQVEREVKAAYLYKFGGYVQWPESAFRTPDAPLRIGIIAADRLSADLARAVIGRSVNGRPVSVQRLPADEPVPGEINLLFIGRDLGEQQRVRILAGLRGRPVLTVTEAGAGGWGGIINFVVVDGRVRFEIAPRLAGAGSLAISARLLAAAYKVL
ncbi:MAG TPA: YfiR family protein [Telluria sp.]|nr:YfiR family protein [Telluria sp.]